jgi:ABC-type transporter Mla MlaB component
LPLAAYKAAVLQDYDYCAIEVSDPSWIDSSVASVEAAEHMARKQNHHSETVSDLDEQILQLQTSYNAQIKKLERERSSVVVAFECCMLYSITGVLENLKFEAVF